MQSLKNEVLQKDWQAPLSFGGQALAELSLDSDVCREVVDDLLLKVKMRVIGAFDAFRDMRQVLKNKLVDPPKISQDGYRVQRLDPNSDELTVMW